MYERLYNNYSMSTCWKVINKRELVIINSYPTSGNGIILLVNSQPQLLLLNSKLFQPFLKFINDADISV